MDYDQNPDTGLGDPCKKIIQKKSMPQSGSSSKDDFWAHTSLLAFIGSLLREKLKNLFVVINLIKLVQSKIELSFRTIFQVYKPGLIWNSIQIFFNPKLKKECQFLKCPIPKPSTQKDQQFLSAGSQSQQILVSQFLILILKPNRRDS
jgi:hypothetical protein